MSERKLTSSRILTLSQSLAVVVLVRRVIVPLLKEQQKSPAPLEDNSPL